jgi:hypothetical protein
MSSILTNNEVKEPSDQRYLPRWDTSNKVYYRHGISNVLLKSQLIDLSCTGCSLYTDKNIQVNDRLEMEIFFSSRDSFQVTGTVIWKDVIDGSTFAGVVFQPLPAYTQELILKNSFNSGKK